jgi:hypothetical protein
MFDMAWGACIGKKVSCTVMIFYLSVATRRDAVLLGMLDAIWLDFD